MRQITMNDHALIDLPEDMEFLPASPSFAGDFDTILYRGASIVTIEPDEFPAAPVPYAGPFGWMLDGVGLMELADDLAAARAAIDAAIARDIASSTARLQAHAGALDGLNDDGLTYDERETMRREVRS